jgi:hypothetical protein
MMRHPAAATAEILCPLDALLLEINDDDSQPRCFSSTSLPSVHPESKGDCRTCSLKRKCSAVSAADLVDAKGKLPCFGAGPQEMNRDHSCGYELCGLKNACSIAHRTLLDRGEFAFMGLALEAVRLGYERKKVTAVPSPPSPPIGSEIRVTTAGTPGGAAHLKGRSEPVCSASIVRAPLPPVKGVRPATFPFDEEAIRHFGEDSGLLSDDELKAAVTSLSRGVHPDGTAGHEYTELRERFLAASIKLNKRGVIAPRFLGRQRLSFPFPPEQQTYARDLQMIDLHWLSCHGRPSPSVDWEDIFLPTGLNFPRAWEFACRKTKPSYKAEFLGLGGKEEHCVSMIQSKQNQAVWKGLHARRGSVIGTIKRAMELPRSRRMDDPDYLYDVFRSLHATNGERSSARSLIGFMGHPVPGKTDFDRQVKWMEKIGLGFTAKAASHSH